MIKVNMCPIETLNSPDYCKVYIAVKVTQWLDIFQKICGENAIYIMPRFLMSYMYFSHDPVEIKCKPKLRFEALLSWQKGFTKVQYKSFTGLYQSFKLMKSSDSFKRRSVKSPGTLMSKGRHELVLLSG